MYSNSDFRAHAWNKQDICNTYNFFLLSFLFSKSLIFKNDDFPKYGSTFVKLHFEKNSSNEYYSKKIKKSHIQLFLNLALKGTLKTRKPGFGHPIRYVHLALRQEGTL